MKDRSEVSTNDIAAHFGVPVLDINIVYRQEENSGKRRHKKDRSKKKKSKEQPPTFDWLEEKQPEIDLSRVEFSISCASTF